MIHQPNADGPADWTTAALVMNRTIATKIATMSNVVSTLGRIPPATRSEISEPASVSVVIGLCLLSGGRARRRPGPHLPVGSQCDGRCSGHQQMYPFGT